MATYSAGRHCLQFIDMPFANTHTPCVTGTHAWLDFALLRVRDLCSSSGEDCTTGRAMSLHRVDHCWEALKTIIFLQNLLIRMKLMRRRRRMAMRRTMTMQMTMIPGMTMRMIRLKMRKSVDEGVSHNILISLFAI